MNSRDPVLKDAFDRIAPSFAGEAGDWQRVLQDARAGPFDQLGGQGAAALRRRLPRRRLAVVALAAAIAVAAPLAIASAVYFRDFPRPSDVPRWAEPTRTGPKLVSAQGEIDGLFWRLVTYRARDENRDGSSRIVLCQEIEFAGKVSGSGGGCGLPRFREEVTLPSIDSLGAGVERTWFVGRVSREASSVTLVLADGRTIEAKTVETPASLRLPYDYYLAIESGQIGGRLGPAVREALARDTGGAIIGRARSDVG